MAESKFKVGSPHTVSADADMLVDLGYELLLLNRWNSQRLNKKGEWVETGKAPAIRKWTQGPRLDSQKTLETAREKGQNVGVRLDLTDLIMDYDPRNDTTDWLNSNSLIELVLWIGGNPEEWLWVDTGGGGVHIYFKKTDGRTLDKVALPHGELTGVEIKSKGRQVVAPGSKHPSGKLYKIQDPDNLFAICGAPDELLQLALRYDKPDTAEVGDSPILLTNDELSEVLHGIGDLSDYDDWVKVLMAAHRVTNGEGLSVAQEWSWEAEEVATKWKSFKTDGNGDAVGWGYLRDMCGSGASEILDAIQASKAGQDFDDLEDFDPEEVPEHERKGPLARMNDEYCAVMFGSRFTIATEVYNPTLDRHSFQFYSKQAFEDYLSNRCVEKMVPDKKTGELKTIAVPIASEWLNWGERRTAEGVHFDPRSNHPNWLNLWTGWPLKAKEGNWSLLRELIEKVLCDGNVEHSNYVLNWIAHMVQKPYERAEVAVCFRGDKGTGKSTLGEALQAMCGRHGLSVHDPKHMVGSFNNHLAQTIFLFGDEAVAPTDKASQGRIKGLITAKNRMLEAKSKDAEPVASFIRILLASNNDWFVDASGDERRYMICEVNNSRQRDFDFFGRLHKQLYMEGGLEAMFHDMQRRDIEGWHPRLLPDGPSDGLTNQKLRNLSVVQKWWFNCIHESQFPGGPIPIEGSDWETESIRAFACDVRENFDEYCRKNQINPGANGRGLDVLFWKEVKKLVEISEKKDAFPEDHVQYSKSKGRQRSYSFPDLQACREQFDEELKVKIDWPS